MLQGEIRGFSALAIDTAVLLARPVTAGCTALLPLGSIDSSGGRDSVHATRSPQLWRIPGGRATKQRGGTREFEYNSHACLPPDALNTMLEIMSCCKAFGC